MPRPLLVAGRPDRPFVTDNDQRIADLVARHDHPQRQKRNRSARIRRWSTTFRGDIDDPRDMADRIVSLILDVRGATY